VLHLRMYDQWSEEDGQDGIPYYSPRFVVLVVRTAIYCIPHDLLDNTVITPITDCACIADHMAEELRPTAPPPHYPRPWAEGSGEGVRWGEAHPPCGQRYTYRR
jgi:hypothetical protein